MRNGGNVLNVEKLLMRNHPRFKPVPRLDGVERGTGIARDPRNFGSSCTGP